MSATEHIVHMRTAGTAQDFKSEAVCDCGWKNEVPWAEAKNQDAAIQEHWREVGFQPKEQS